MKLFNLQCFYHSYLLWDNSHKYILFHRATGPSGSRSSYLLGFTRNYQGGLYLVYSLASDIDVLLFENERLWTDLPNSLRRSINPTRHNCQSGVGHTLDAHWSALAVPIIVSNLFRFDGPRKTSLSKQAEACAERRKEWRIAWRGASHW